MLEIEIAESEQSIRKSIKMDAYINIPEDREFPESDRVYVQLHGSCLLIAWCYLAPIAAALAVLMDDDGLGPLMRRAILAARDRSVELGS